MNDATILRTLAQVRFRLTAARAVETGLRAALYAAAAAALIVAASAAAFSFLPAWYRAFAYPFAPLLLIPAAFLFGAVLRLARPVTLRDAAIYLDRQAGLLERVTTAYELSRRNDPDAGLGQLVCDEARQICSDFRPSTIRYSRSAAPLARYLAAAFLVCTAALFLPPYKTDAFLRDQNRQISASLAVTELSQLVTSPATNSSTDQKITSLLQQAERAAGILRDHPDSVQARTDLERAKLELKTMLKDRQNPAANSAVAAGSNQPNVKTSDHNTPPAPGPASNSTTSSAAPAAPGQSSPAAGTTEEAKIVIGLTAIERAEKNLPPPGPPAGGSTASLGAANSATAPARSDSPAGPWAKIYNPHPAPPSSAVAANHGSGQTATTSDLPASPGNSARSYDDRRLPDDLRDLARKYFSGDQP